MMWEAARDKITAAGGTILMGHAMKQLAADGQGAGACRPRAPMAGKA
jgi:hypothetical protein